MIDFASIGRRIKEERRLNKRVSQETMAGDLNMYQADISNLERANKGSGINDLYRLDRVANYLGIPTQQLIFGMDEKDAMVKYTATPNKLKRLKSLKKIPESHTKTLEHAFNCDFERLSIKAFQYGPYSIYFVTYLNLVTNAVNFGPDNIQDLILERYHGFTFYNDRVIASMSVSIHNIFHFMNQPILHHLQQSLIPYQVIDVVDIARHLNPYIALLHFAEGEEEQKRYEDLYWNRMNELRMINDRHVLLIHSLYVKEDCRRNGIATMMLDTVTSLFQDPLLWLNLQPTDVDELEHGLEFSPACSNFEMGQMSLNAHIAERMGFTVDPEIWHLPMQFKNERGFIEYKGVEVLKSAFKMPKHVKAIIESDGELVQLGRAKQKLAQEKDKRTTKMTVVWIHDSPTLEIECPYCGAKIIANDEPLHNCPHVLFHASQEGVEYVRQDLPWTFGECDPDEPLKEGDVAWDEDVSMDDYISKLVYPGAICYAIESPAPYMFTSYVAFSETTK